MGDAAAASLTDDAVADAEGRKVCVSKSAWEEAAECVSASA